MYACMYNSKYAQYQTDIGITVLLILTLWLILW